MLKAFVLPLSDVPGAALCLLRTLTTDRGNYSSLWFDVVPKHTNTHTFLPLKLNISRKSIYDRGTSFKCPELFQLHTFSKVIFSTDVRTCLLNHVF